MSYRLVENLVKGSKMWQFCLKVLQKEMCTIRVVQNWARMVASPGMEENISTLNSMKQSSSFIDKSLSTGLFSVQIEGQDSFREQNCHAFHS